MKKEHILAILFFSGLWGLSEAVLGGRLYAAGMNDAACVILAVVALGILAAARACVPWGGSSTAIAALAMLYKFLNAPFFACHLLAILFLGAAFDAAYSLARGKYKPVIGAAATWVGFAAFALLTTYVFRYRWWADEGWPKVFHYVAVNGTLAAVCNAVVVPMGDRLARRLMDRSSRRIALRAYALPALSVVTLGVWVLAAVQML